MTHIDSVISNSENSAKKERTMSRRKIKIPLIISLALFSPLGIRFALGFAPVHAQPNQPVAPVQSQNLNPSKQSKEPIIYNEPSQPSGVGQPVTTTAGGSRGCKLQNEEKPLTALLPKSGSGWGLTTDEHPAFWFFVPFSPTLSGKFVLKDETNKKTVYDTYFTVSGTPGVVELRLPTTASSLSVNTRYHWYYNIDCQQGQPPIYVEGFIQRNSITADLKNQLEKATPRQRVALYAAKGFWYNALTESAELRRKDPNDDAWNTLLQAGGLGAIAKEPIVECCTVSDSKK